MASETSDIVFLFDVDNTLLDNDRVQQELREHLEASYGRAARERYWAIYDELFGTLGYADYIGALERYRLERLHDPSLLRMSTWLLDYPFVDRLYPASTVVIHISLIQLLVAASVMGSFANAVLRVFLRILGQAFHYPRIATRTLEPFGDPLLPGQDR